MAKAVVSAKREINHGIHEEFPLKVIYSDSEPSRNYIWGHPNGNYYVWTDCKWVKMELPNCKKEESCCNKCCDCVSKDWIEVRLEKFKKDVLSAFIRISKNSCDDDSAIEDWVRSEIERIDRDITNLKDVDTGHNEKFDELDQADADTDARLDALEAHDTTNCVTAVDVEPEG